jgi:hypothetical protein
MGFRHRSWYLGGAKITARILSARALQRVHMIAWVFGEFGLRGDCTWHWVQMSRGSDRRGGQRLEFMLHSSSD